jgi:uncharacterized protein YprB with RNaseH-like and TPR domain
VLRRTFVHVPRVGRSTEAALWSSGARTWDEFLALRREGRLQGGRYDAIAAELAASQAAFERRDAAYYGSRLAGAEQWRLYREFADVAAYVDIETTGLSPDQDDITVVAMHAGGATRTFVLGRDLDEFTTAAARFPLVVTFNGASFDLPFLARKFRGFRPPAHLDLRYPLKALGYSGGLKSIERQAGIERSGEVRDVDGWEAVRLWHAHRRGERGALERLLAYAAADVENLVPLARMTAGGMAARLGFD